MSSGWRQDRSGKRRRRKRGPSRPQGPSPYRNRKREPKPIPPRRNSNRTTSPAWTEPAGIAMRIGEAVRKLDDGALMRGAFYALLCVSAAFLFVDIREIANANAELPGFDPMREDQPVLPPALTDGVPAAPPVQP